MKLPLEYPQPNIDLFKKVISGQIIPDKPPFVELKIDKEIMAEISERLLGRKWIDLSEDKESRKKYWDNFIEVYYRMGYDYVFISGSISWHTKFNEANDTADFSKGQRNWVEEGKGVISTWEDFRNYPWPESDNIDLWDYEYVTSHVPEGMGVLACPTWGFLEVPLHLLFGYENMCLLLFDDPDLVKAVFERIGQIIYSFYNRIVGFPNIAGFFQGDDMGFKTSTIFSPEVLRKHVLPWHKKLAQLAHDSGLIYMLHSCGNLDDIMEDLINDVKIDAKHSFEDVIMPVTEFSKKYSSRVGVLGGVDVDKLCRLSENDLRKYIRNILENCVPQGRYALGSGNSIANYIPLDNYLIMLDEGLKYKRIGGK